MLPSGAMTRHYESRAALDVAPGPPLLLSRRGAADRLAVGVTTIDMLIGSGQVRSVRIGRARRVVAASLEDFIERLAAEAAHGH